MYQNARLMYTRINVFNWEQDSLLKKIKTIIKIRQFQTVIHTNESWMESFVWAELLYNFSIELNRKQLHFVC